MYFAHRSTANSTFAISVTVVALVAALLTVTGVRVAPAAAQDGAIVITEVFYNPDGQAEGSEFFELHNPTDAPVDLTGWGMLQGVDLVFAAGSTISAGGHLAVARDAAEFQALFNRSPDDVFAGGLNNGGETLLLVDANGAVVDRVDYDDNAPWPTSPDGDGTSLQLFDPLADNSLADAWGAGTPSPGAPNSVDAAEVAAPVATEGRGVYPGTVTETLTTTTPGARIHYTLNGRAPSGSSTVYSGPITIAAPSSGLVTLRAVAVRGASTSAEVVHSYVFTSTFRYGNGNWEQVPTVSIQTDDRSLPTGSSAEERMSVDFIDPDGSGFGVTAGVKLFGESSVNHAKKSHRLFFDDEWGPSDLTYDIFEDSGYGTYDPVDVFDKLELRGHSWDGPNQLPAHNYYISDRFWKDSILELGSLSPHSRSVHLFLNGDYNGVYQLRERYDNQWLASYTGADPDEYDSIKINRGATNGSSQLWSALSRASSWTQAKDLLDPRALIHHELLLSLEAYGEEEYRLVGSPDPEHPDAGGIILYSDVDMLFGDAVGGGFWNWGPHGPQSNGTGFLKRWGSDPELKQHSYAESYRAFCNAGPMTVAATTDRVDRLADELRPAMTAELNRWPAGSRFEQSMQTAKERLSGSRGMNYVAQQWQSQGHFAGCAAGGRPEPTVANTVVFTGRDAEVPLGIADPDDDPYTVSVLSGLPAGLSISSDGVLSGTPNAEPGDYALRLRIEDNRSMWGEWDYTITVVDSGNAIADSPLLLNEYNAVDDDAGSWAGSDPAFPDDPANGGDWLELAVAQDYADLRGWKIELWDRDNDDRKLKRSDTYTFANNPAWAALRSTSLIVLAEDVEQDAAIAPEGGDWNIVVNPNAGLIYGGAGFDTTRRDFMLVVRNPQGDLVGDPVGETAIWSAAAPGRNVSAGEVMALCVTPSDQIDVIADYAEEPATSTFGQANVCGGQAQELAGIRSSLLHPGDADCSRDLSGNDTQLVLEFGVGLRANTPGCPIADPATQLNAYGADINGDGSTGLLDALLIARCSAGLDGGFCPEP